MNKQRPVSLRLVIYTRNQIKTFGRDLRTQVISDTYTNKFAVYSQVAFDKSPNADYLLVRPLSIRTNKRHTKHIIPKCNTKWGTVFHVQHLSPAFASTWLSRAMGRFITGRRFTSKFLCHVLLLTSTDIDSVVARTSRIHAICTIFHAHPLPIMHRRFTRP